MDPKLVGDECIKANPKNLAYENKVMFYILCNSLTPTNRPGTNHGIMANALLATTQGIRFDIPDVIIRSLAYAADSPQALKPYAPWVMFSIEQLIEEKILFPHIPKVYMPSVHDTLRIVNDIGKGRYRMMPLFLLHVCFH